MSFLKQFAGETAIYGVSSILSRVLHYFFLTAYLTRVLVAGEYSIHGIMYGYAAVLIVLLSYRMETAFFRFGSEDGQLSKAFSSAFTPLLVTTIAFTGITVVAAEPIAGFLTSPKDARFVVMFAIIVGLDVLAAVPFAKLRLENRAVKFATIKVINVIVTIIFTFFFLELCPYLANKGYAFFDKIYDQSLQLDYIFFSNILASTLMMLLLLPDILKVKLSYDHKLFRRMIWYAWPLVIVGVAGAINQVADRFVLKEWLPGDEQDHYNIQGIYTACAKLAIILNLFTQAFNYAAEPFFFKNAAEKDAPVMYAQIARAFAIVAAFAFLVTTLFLEDLKYIIGPEYRGGLSIVPILLVGYIFLGLHYNFAVWYKITDKTRIGGLIAVAGTVVILLANYLLIPHIGYEAPAWAVVACYGTMASLTYFVGKRYFPIPYPIITILGYTALAVILYLLFSTFEFGSLLWRYIAALICMSLYGGVVWWVEKDHLGKLLW